MDILIAGFFGGVLRGIIEFMDKKVSSLGSAVIFLALQGFVGLVFALAFIQTGYISGLSYTGQMIAMALGGYAGTDIINSVYEILYKQRLK